MYSLKIHKDKKRTGSVHIIYQIPFDWKYKNSV